MLSIVDQDQDSLMISRFSTFLSFCLSFLARSSWAFISLILEEYLKEAEGGGDE